MEFVLVLAVSVDNIDSHMGWRKDIIETQNCTVDFPIIADEAMKVANLYGIVHPKASETAPVRSLLIVSPDKKK